MQNTVPELTPEQERALSSQEGFVAGPEYVLMSRDVFDRLGVADPEADLAAIEEGLADIEAGRTRPMDDVFRDLNERHGLPG